MMMSDPSRLNEALQRAARADRQAIRRARTPARGARRRQRRGRGSGGAGEEQRDAERLGVGGVDGPAPERVPAHDDGQQREQVRRVADAAGTTPPTGTRRPGPTRLATGPPPSVLKNHTGSVGVWVASAMSQISAGGEQQHAREFADAGGTAWRCRVATSQISMMTGSTSGRWPRRFRKKRRSSTPIRSRMIP